MTIIQSNSNIIESVNPKTLSKKDLEKIVEIEQDMWAREDGLGEYIKCECCNKIYSKENIFGHLSKEIKIQTVKKIEETIDFDIVCPECKSKVKSIYDREEYIESVLDRYKNTIESFLTVYRDENGEIRGFFDGYIDTFENIYEREFSNYYSNFGASGIKKIIKENTGMDLPDKMLMCSALGMEYKYRNFFNLYDMMKIFFYEIYYKKGENLFGIAESSIGSNTHSIYHSVGAKSVGILKYNTFIKDKKEGKLNDLFIHPRITRDYFNKFSLSPRAFIKENLKYMKEVLAA